MRPQKLFIFFTVGHYGVACHRFCHADQEAEIGEAKAIHGAGHRQPDAASIARFGASDLGGRSTREARLAHVRMAPESNQITNRISIQGIVHPANTAQQWPMPSTFHHAYKVSNCVWQFSAILGSIGIILRHWKAFEMLR